MEEEKRPTRISLVLFFRGFGEQKKSPVSGSRFSFPFPVEHLNHEQIPSLFSKPGKAFQDKSKQSMGLAPCSKSLTQEDDLERSEVSPYPAGSAQVGLPQLPRLAECKS